MNNKKSREMGGASIFMIVVLALLVYWFIGQMNMKQREYTYQEFTQAIQEGDVKSVIIRQNKEVPTGRLEIHLSDQDEDVKYLNVSDVNEVQAMLNKEGINCTVNDVPRESWFMTTMLPTLLMVGAVIFLFMMMNRQGGGANAKAMNFGKSRARMTSGSDKQVKFAQVAGLREEKEELEEIVDFLKSPKKYIQVGARIPKGVLLVGPPGTGKTLLAKAVAGEAGVPFFTISGSDFVEMFVGVGASRVRDLFEDAKKHAPCIIFIDEIDAGWRKNPERSSFGRTSGNR